MTEMIEKVARALHQELAGSDQGIPLVDLELTCPECAGRGWLEGPMRCDACGGQGAIPTEQGRRILEFVWRRLP